MLRCLAILTCLLAAGEVPAQRRSDADRRDVVVIRTGREVRGRVLTPFDPDRVLVVENGKRTRIRRADIESMTTVNDHLREFLARRNARPADTVHDWVLAEWAHSKGLHDIARLQALHVLLAAPDHERAHRFLGHRRAGHVWLWPLGSQHVSLQRHREHHADMGHPLELRSLHFLVRTDAGLRRAIDLLLDLERLYLVLRDELGEKLQAREVLEPMAFQVWREEGDFPRFTGLGLPYYFPDPNGDVARTFYRAADAPRPDLLFGLGVEHWIYHALTDAVSATPTSPQNRIAAWLENGLGQWYEGRMAGPPGRAAAGEPRIELEHARLALQVRPYRLANLLGLRFGQWHDVTDLAAVHWATSATFVAFLMHEGPEGKAPFRDRLLEFTRRCYVEGRGSSSSLLDKVLGVKIERVEPEYLRWLEQKTGLRRRQIRR